MNLDLTREEALLLEELLVKSQGLWLSPPHDAGPICKVGLNHAVRTAVDLRVKLGRLTGP